MEFVLLFVDRKDQPPRAPLYEEMRKFAGELREAGVMRLSAGQLAALIEGLDWTLAHVPRVPRPQATQ